MFGNRKIKSENIKNIDRTLTKIGLALNLARTDECRSRLFQATVKIVAYQTAISLSQIWY